MFKPKVLLIILVAGALAAVGFLFFRPPRPEILLAAEELFSFGPIKVTNTILTAWLVIIFLTLLSWRATTNMKSVPSGLQNLVEAGLEAFLNLVETVAGRRNGRRFFPLVATILLYVLVSNWFGLLPFFSTVGKFEEAAHGAVISEAAGIHVIKLGAGGIEEGASYVLPDGTVVGHGEEKEADSKAAPADAHGATPEGTVAEDVVHLSENQKVGIIVPFLRGVNTDLNATLAIALTAVFSIQFWGIRELGIAGYGSKFINTRKLRQGKIVDGVIDLFVGGLELISEFARIISFTFRLFGNIFAGEVLVLIITFLVPFLAIEIFFFLELFVGFIQAFVFAMLTLVFGVMAVAGHGDHAESASEPGVHHGEEPSPQM